jgi:hypothetical protein
MLLRISAITKRWIATLTLSARNDGISYIITFYLFWFEVLIYEVLTHCWIAILILSARND